MAASVYSRAVQRASELVGGGERLARRLRVPRADIEQWIAGKAKPPREIFLRIVDLILDETAMSSHDPDADTPPSRDAAGADRHFEN
jgi:DNA-binding transcriptional regulator YdaS (Cro superfamily)